MDHQAAIAKLKSTVLHTKDFNAAWNEFFDLSVLPQFIKKSRPSKLENLQPILQHIGLALAPNETGTLKADMMLQYADSGLYHGSLIGANKAGTFMYFKDLNMGMAALVNLAGGGTNFCRFTATIVNSPHCYTAPATANNQATTH